MDDACVECPASSDGVANAASVHHEMESSLGRPREGEGNQLLNYSLYSSVSKLNLLCI